MKSSANIFNKPNAKNSGIVVAQILHDLEIGDVARGTGLSATTEVKYKNNAYTFHKYNNDNKVIHVLFEGIDQDFLHSCIVITIDKDEKIAHINHISYDSKCFQQMQNKTSKDKESNEDVDEEYKYENKGNRSESEENDEEENFIKLPEFGMEALVKIALKLIDNVKLHYDLKEIHVTDDATQFCKPIGRPIEMSSLYMLSMGDTWYGALGFLPYNENTRGIHLLNNNACIINKNVVKEIKIKNTNIKSIFVQVIDEVGYDNLTNVGNIKNIVRYFEKHENDSVVNFFNRLMKNFDDYCDIFSLVYDKVMVDLRMHNLQGIKYFKKL